MIIDKRVSGNTISNIKNLVKATEELLSAERIVIEESELLRIVLRNSPFGMVGAERDGTIIFANDCFLSIVKHNENEIIGKSFFDLIHLDDKKKLIREWSDRTKNLSYFPSRYIRSSGETRWIRLWIQKINMSFNHIEHEIYSVIHIEDITELACNINESKLDECEICPLRDAAIKYMQGRL